MPDLQVPVSRPQAAVGLWLVCVAAMVCAMVVLGGVTRLTHSGLSMVEWRPITGWLPPLNETAWQEAFDQYKLYPEFRDLNYRMTLAEFQSIYAMEYAHRLWGRLIGVAFIVPFVVFLARGRIDRGLGWGLAAILVLGGLQGALGWYMVASGLADEPDVSPYRLTAHLGLALAILAWLQWMGMGLIRPRERSRPRPAEAALRPALKAIIALVFLTALSGGFVAGLDAGFIYNTFPLMDGRLVPPDLWEASPWYLNFFENIVMVQFVHRLAAMITVAAVIVLWLGFRRAGLRHHARRAVHVLVLVALAQAGLGIATLVLVVPVPVAAAHQAGALALFAVALWGLHETWPAPKPSSLEPARS